MAAVAVPDLVVDVFDVVEESARLEIFDDRLAALPAIHPAVFRAGQLVHVRVVGHYIDLGEVVALAHEEVVRIVRRRYLHDAGAEFAIYVVVGDDGYLAPRQRKHHGLPDEVRIAVVLRIDGDRRIARKRLRARRRDHDVVLVRLACRALLAPHDGIADVPEVAVVRLVLDLVVGERGAAARAPVHDVVAFIDQPFVVELREDFGDGLRAAFVERETLAPPVRGVTEHALLVDDRAAVLLLPFPDALDERLAPEILPALAFLLQRFLHDVLRGDARMVRAGQPEGVEAAHPAPSHEYVLDRLVERVPHVENAGDVRRRDDDRIRLALARLCMETTVLFPEGIPLGLRGLRVVMLVHSLFWNGGIAVLALSICASRLYFAGRGGRRPLSSRSFTIILTSVSKSPLTIHRR